MSTKRGQKISKSPQTKSNESHSPELVLTLMVPVLGLILIFAGAVLAPTMHINTTPSMSLALAGIAIITGLILVLAWLASFSLTFVAMSITKVQGVQWRPSKFVSALSPRVMQQFVALTLGLNLSIAPGAATELPGHGGIVFHALSVVNQARDRSGSIGSTDTPIRADFKPLSPVEVQWKVSQPSRSPVTVNKPIDPRWSPLSGGPKVEGRAPAQRLFIPLPNHHAEEPSSVTVRAGDTLWSIAARALGPSASNTDIARAWPLWYSENRLTIGPNPHYLVPGWQLHAPNSK